MFNLKEDNNYNYYQKIDYYYNNYDNSISYYQEILLLIYDIFYKHDNFNYINPIISQMLNNMIKLLIIEKNLYLIDENKTFNINDKQSYINLLIALNQNNYNENLKNYLITIINTYAPNKINQFKEIPLEVNCIYNWFLNNQININDDIINIKGIKIPNFVKINKIYNLIDLNFEFYHLLYKIYKPVIEQDFSFYEAGKYNITQNDIVFDCGANLGLFSIYAAAKGAKVYAFEPMSYIRYFLKEAQKLYPNNIIIIPAAVGIKTETKIFNQMHNPGASGCKGGFMENASEKVYLEQVPVIRLDDFIENNNIHPTFIKMDIEGSELFALKGCYNYLKNNKIVLSISLDHGIEDKTLIPNFINMLNLDYNIFYYTKGDIADSQFMLCK